MKPSILERENDLARFTALAGSCPRRMATGITSELQGPLTLSMFFWCYTNLKIILEISAKPIKGT